MNKKILEYDVCEGPDLFNPYARNRFIELINNKIKEGWEPFGSIIVRDGNCYHPIVKNKKIVEYDILGGIPGKYIFIEKMNSMIKDGWQPFGPLVAIRDCYYQSMVKYND